MALDNLDILHTLSDQMEYLKLPDPESLDQTEIIIRRAMAIVDFLPDFQDKNLVLGQLSSALVSQLEVVRQHASDNGEYETKEDFMSLLHAVQQAIFTALHKNKYQLEKQAR